MVLPVEKEMKYDAQPQGRLKVLFRNVAGAVTSWEVEQLDTLRKSFESAGAAFSASADELGMTFHIEGSQRLIALLSGVLPRRKILNFHFIRSVKDESQTEILVFEKI